MKTILFSLFFFLGISAWGQPENDVRAVNDTQHTGNGVYFRELTCFVEMIDSNIWTVLYGFAGAFHLTYTGNGWNFILPKEFLTEKHFLLKCFSFAIVYNLRICKLNNRNEK